MCVLIISYNILAEASLILAANRDEFHQRPASPISYWTDKPNILAGQDLKSGGTWLGITRQGRIAAVTNFRDPSIHLENAPSRGFLVGNFLESMEAPESYIGAITKTGEKYNGYRHRAQMGTSSVAHLCYQRHLWNPLFLGYSHKKNRSHNLYGTNI